MSRRRNFHENAVAESFRQPLKREQIRRKIYRSPAEASSDVFEYIETFYNPKRGMSQVKFEQRWAIVDSWLSTKSDAIPFHGIRKITC